MKIYAILTGKKNSTLKNKNILKILKQRVFIYPAKSARKSKNIEKYFTSSDSKVMLNETKKIGYIPINRPAYLSSKNSKHRDVLLHSLKFIKTNLNILPDVVLVLLANSPTIKTKWIDECVKIMKNQNVDAVVPVVKNNDHHPLRAKQIKNNILKPYLKMPKNMSTNRQELTSSYFLAHNFWLIKTSCIYNNKGLMPWAFMGKKVVAYEIDESIDIHNTNDIENCKKWLLKNKNIL
ncbi:hypothetical protein N8012_01375 [Pelagibacteraceae bacterium]|nr:hypothetical protein [Pelagibacteraceae bacterium]